MSKRVKGNSKFLASKEGDTRLIKLIYFWINLSGFENLNMLKTNFSITVCYIVVVLVRQRVCILR